MSTIARRTMSSSLTAKPSKHRHEVPVRTQVSWPTATRPFVTDGGLETDLIHNRGEELPEFAAYPLVRTERGRALLEEYFDGYAAIAREHGTGLVLETPTWRASAEWGARLGDSRRDLHDVNVQAVRHLLRLREERYDDIAGVLISGAMGPRADAYADIPPIDPDEAQMYHERQIDAFAEGGVDLVTAFTLSNPGEAVGLSTARIRGTSSEGSTTGRGGGAS